MEIQSKNSWLLSRTETNKVRCLAKDAGVSETLAQLLINRGIDDAEKANIFFNPSLDDCYNPFLMKGMRKASERIRRAIREKNKILVFGDFDVDGLTGTALLYRVLSEMCHECIYTHIPDRVNDGYGLNEQVFEFVKKEGIRVVITVDCGISSGKEALLAQKYGVDLIITDHHHPPDELPLAYAIVNPKQPDCSYPFRELSGVGLAMKLLHGILIFSDELADASADRRYMPLPEQLWEHLDLVALGTIADIVPLLDENRIFVKHGLATLTASQKPGIQALKKISGLDCKNIDSFDVGFKLAPRINAVGRIGNPLRGLSLLTTESEGEASLLADELDNENQKRKEIEKVVLAEAKEMCGANDCSKKNIIILSSESWHPGVIGIVASRLSDEFFLPTILIAVKDGIGRGSGRSIPGFHMYENVSCCGDFLVSFGGHERAAGLSVKKDDIQKFKEKMEGLALRNLSGGKLKMSIPVDGKISLDDLSLEKVESLGSMAPFGEGNKEPVFCSESIQVMRYPSIVGNNHLRLKVRKKARAISAIWFSMGKYKEFLLDSEPVDIVFIPQVNCWRDRKEVQLKIKDMKTS